MKFNPKQMFLYDKFSDIRGGKAPRFEDEDEFLKAYNNVFSGNGLSKLDDDNFADSSGNPIPKANFEQFLNTKNKKTITTPNGQIISAPGGDGNANKVTVAPGEGSVQEHKSDGTVKESEGNTNAADNDVKTNVDGYDDPGKYNTFDFDKSLKELKRNQSFVDDYYKDSMASSWKNLSPEDRKILLYDQLGTSLKNALGYRPKLYGAFGNVVDEGREAGDEKSLLQEGLKKSYEAGLTRRNERLDNQMQEQLKVANFPAELNMRMTELWENLKTNNRAKANLIRIMSNVNWLDALKTGVINITQNGEIINTAGKVLGTLGTLLL